MMNKHAKPWKHILRSSTIAGILLLLSGLPGCGESKEMREMGFQGPPPVVPKSEAITNFMGREGITSLYLGFDEVAKDTAGTRTAASQPKFVELYEAFKSEPIPKSFKSDQREQDKAKLVQALDALIEAVKKNGTDEEIRGLAKPIRPAVEAFMRPTNY